ncbi:putative expansin-B2 [Raphanus sativus]|uniref:Expansin-B2 n=1 Tax=Raphanus sativus TaxID=3726 RepID=A0A6J0M394_RAPSA|nr:putative expansin-B2 [Raphanus sativus]KAJ4892357.1 putative expansin-B2 [Raphanus sativus]
MAILVLQRCYIIMNLLFGLTFVLLNSAHCFNPKRFNISAATDGSDWSQAGATWYGLPTGYGTDGGACGYKNAVAQAPFSSMVSAGGPSLYKSGKGCGACYQIKCTSKPDCSTNPVTVVITDECNGCVEESVHFDLSGTAFGALASSGRESQLRDVGVLQILYRKVECNYNGKTVEFQVDKGSNAYSFAVLVEYEDGEGEISLVELKQASVSDTWLPMNHSWGAVWKLDVTSPLRAPLSLRLTYLDSRETVAASDVIPAGWQPGETYKSNVNFLLELA